MLFQPENITEDHVLKAVARIESEQIPLKPSTRFDVIINGKTYPPKEVMRFAHAEMNGERLWSVRGGKPTNDYLKKFGFEIVKKHGTDHVLEMISKYKQHIRETQFADESYKWQLLQKMRGRPDVNAPDFFLELKGIAFKNLVYPMGIAVLLHIARERAEELRNCFVKLYDDEADLTQRVKTFSDETLRIYREINGKLNHHQDERSMATYLTFHNPDRYTLFKTTVYEAFCDLIKVEKKKPKEKYVHYLELLDDFVSDYILNDEELVALKDQYLPKDRFDDKDHRLLAQDILYQMLDKVPRQVRKNERRYWRVGTSDSNGNYWNQMKSGGFASIGWPDLGDLSAEDIEKKEISEMLTEAGYYDGNRGTITRKAGEIYNFLKVIKPGDVVLAQDGNRVLGVGVIEDEDVAYYPEESFPHARNVTWKMTEPEDFYSEDGKLTTVFEITDKETISRADQTLFSIVSTTIMMNTDDQIQPAKNAILYGPPGTGKTYNSINHAVAILESKPIRYVASEPRAEVKRRFDDYQEAGRIVFTTFHQSMSYEDFIEGIKPKVLNNQVVYQIEHGLFKRISIDAAFSITQLTDSKEAKKVLTFYQLYDQMVASIEETLSNENASVFYPTKSGGQIQIEGISEQGNIVVRHIDGTRSYVVSKERLAKLDQAIANLDDVSNIDTEFREIIGGSNSSAYWAVLRTLRTLKPQGTTQAKGEYSIEDKLAAVKTLRSADFRRTDLTPYVIIIDEINRGNISQIFGELITLIEDDKRLGKKEAIEITLPYSKERYGIPPNLYIIGTMNTADRSIEALDTALRRRFSFHEKAVKPDLIRTEGASKGIIESIDVVKMLETINQRIEKLIDKDHQIGHAYFMDCQTIPDLKNAFQNKVIPLLQEYFFGDYGKIGLVLGNDFIVKQDNSQFTFAKFKGFDDDGSVAEDLRTRAIYKIKDQSDWNFNSIYA